MAAQALVVLIYGLAMAATGWSAHRRFGNRIMLAGAGSLGGLATLGGLLMLVGSGAGLGLAILATVVAALVFGFVVSQSILNHRTPGQSLVLFLASVAVAAWLVVGARAGADL